jgi:hypothetical protein
VQWLLVSLVLSVVLTVLVNVFLLAFPDAGRRAAERLEQLASPAEGDGPRSSQRVRVFAPWRAMLVASVILTILVNLVLWAR